MARKEFNRAETALRELLSIDGNYHAAAERLALLLAVHPDLNARRPSEAILLAERACQLTDYQDATYLETLSAAYGAGGRLQDAADTVMQALKIARQSGQTALAKTLQDRIDRFRQHQASQRSR
jgi:tetratricopeptide (TPR) repeat protein